VARPHSMAGTVLHVAAHLFSGELDTQHPGRQWRVTACRGHGRCVAEPRRHRRRGRHGPVINRFGPYIPVATIVGIGAIFVALLGQNLGSVPVMMIVLFTAGAGVIGGQLNFPAMTVELFPPHVRGAGGGWTVGVGRIGSIVGPLLAER